MQLAVYAGLQIPVGVVLDRVGPRRLVTVGALTDGGRAAGAGDGARRCAGGDRPDPGRRRRRDDVHQRPAPDHGVVLAPAGAAADPDHRDPRPARADRRRLPAGGVASGCRVERLVPRRGRRSGPGCERVARCGTPRPARPSVFIAVSGREAVRRLGHAWREPGTRLGCGPTSSPSSPAPCSRCCGAIRSSSSASVTAGAAGLLITLLVLVAMVVGPVLGHLAGRWPFRRSVPVLAILGATVAVWTIVLAWPGRAPLACSSCSSSCSRPTPRAR